MLCSHAIYDPRSAPRSIFHVQCHLYCSSNEYSRTKDICPANMRHSSARLINLEVLCCYSARSASLRKWLQSSWFLGLWLVLIVKEIFSRPNLCFSQCPLDLLEFQRVWTSTEMMMIKAKYTHACHMCAHVYVVITS